MVANLREDLRLLPPQMSHSVEAIGLCRLLHPGRFRHLCNWPGRRVERFVGMIKKEPERILKCIFFPLRFLVTD